MARISCFRPDCAGSIPATYSNVKGVKILKKYFNLINEKYIENALDEADKEAENPKTKYYSHGEFKNMARRTLDGKA